MSDLIKLGDTVVIRLHDEKCYYVIKAEGIQKIARKRVTVKNMIGRPFGSIFEIEQSHLKYIPGDSASIIDDLNSDIFSADPQAEQAIGDNRGYSDTNSAQKLKSEDIEQMRSAGASGSEIIQNLISNSETWGNKTSFAQEKWMKKKQQKYTKRFRVLKATPASICEVYNNKNLEKICGMRGDLLAQIIYQSGVRAGSNLLVFESVIGLVVGTAAYKMKGVGRIYAAYEGQQPHFELVNSLNLSTEDTDIIQPVPCAELAAAADHVLSHGFLPHTTRSAPTMLPSGYYSGKKQESSSGSGGNPGNADGGSSEVVTEDGPDSKRSKTSVLGNGVTNPNATSSSTSATLAPDDCAGWELNQGPIRRHNTSGRQVAVLEHTRHVLRAGFNR